MKKGTYIICSILVTIAAGLFGMYVGYLVSIAALGLLFFGTNTATFAHLASNVIAATVAVLCCVLACVVQYKAYKQYKITGFPQRALVIQVSALVVAILPALSLVLLEKQRKSSETINSTSIRNAQIQKVSFCGVCKTPGLCAPCSQGSQLEVIALSTNVSAEHVGIQDAPEYVHPKRIIKLHNSDYTAQMIEKLEVGKCYDLSLSSEDNRKDPIVFYLAFVNKTVPCT